MTTLTDEDIRQYIATGEPMDKAGAYAIQGMASRWIPRIEGDYFNVVGLPVSAGLSNAPGARVAGRTIGPNAPEKGGRDWLGLLIGILIPVFYC